MPIGGALGAIGNAIIGGLNYKEQKETNKKNLEEQKRQYDQNFQFQKENMEYQKKLQQQIFSREDNAVQRQAIDMEAAGLSKNLAAGGGANAGAVVNTQAPQGMAPQGMAAQMSGIDMLNMSTTLAQQKLLQAQADKTEAEADQTREDTVLTKETVLNKQQERKLTEALQKAKEEEAKLLSQKTLNEKEQERLIKLQKANAEAEKVLKAQQINSEILKQDLTRQQIGDAKYDRDKSEKANMRTTDKKDLVGAGWSLGGLIGELLGK